MKKPQYFADEFYFDTIVVCKKSENILVSLY